MSRSDRGEQPRPPCFGEYDINERGRRGCGLCGVRVSCEGMKIAGTRAFNPLNAASNVAAAAPIVERQEHSKYHREIKPGVFVDVYDVLQAFDVRNPALQHLVKKALAPGQRGHKDRATDLDEIVQSAIRAKELEA